MGKKCLLGEDWGIFHCNLQTLTKELATIAILSGC